MPENIYGIVAGIMRYIFILLGGIIVLRAFFMLRRERRETRRMLRRLPDAGNVGELTVVHACDGYSEGTVIPVPREGVLGCLRSCDISVCAPDIRRKHLDFSFENGLGLLISPRSGCSALVDGLEFNCRTVSAGHPMVHGSYLQIGDLVLRLRLFAGVDIDRSARFADSAETAPFPPVMMPPAEAYYQNNAAVYNPVRDDRGDFTQNTSGFPGEQYCVPASSSDMRMISRDQDPGNTVPRRRKRSERWDGDWSE